MNSEEIKAIRAAKRVAEMQAPPINSDFISISELLARLKTAPDKPPRTMTDAAEWMLFNWCNAENAPAWKCNGKLGIVLIDAFSAKHEIPLNRLHYVFHHGHFESDDGNGSSLDYEYFGFDRHEFAAFMNLLGEPLDLFFPMTQPAPAQTLETPAPVVAGSKKWTDEKLAELKTYREAHTMPETAVKFGISEQRIRELLPSEKAKAKPFAGLTHRIK